MNKKILIIINNLGIGGAERLVVGDINEMLRIGVDVTLVTLKREPEKSFVSQLNLEKDKFHCVSFKNFFDVSSWFNVVRIIKSYNPDLIITHLWFSNTIGRIAGRLAGSRNIISFEQNVYDTVKTGKMFLVDWLLQFLSTKVIAVSEGVRRSLVRHSIKEAKIDVLYNSIDLSAFTATGHHSEVRRKYDIPENAFLFIFIGRLIYQKAVDVLIEAFKRINDIEAYLLIVGQGEDHNILQDRVKESGLGKHVIFAGVQSNVPELLSSSDCFVLPSRYEGLPLVLVEALASGIAIIVSDFGSAQEVITHGENGLVVPREDSGALAEAMTRVKNDSALRSSLASESKKSAERFSTPRHVKAILRYVNPTGL